jgi:hypothetical protein
MVGVHAPHVEVHADCRRDQLQWGRLEVISIEVCQKQVDGRGTPARQDLEKYPGETIYPLQASDQSIAAVTLVCEGAPPPPECVSYVTVIGPLMAKSAELLLANKRSSYVPGPSEAGSVKGTLPLATPVVYCHFM